MCSEKDMLKLSSWYSWTSELSMFGMAFCKLNKTLKIRTP